MKTAALLCALTVSLSQLHAAAGGRPNFLFILIDDLGWADVGFNNPDTFYETPNLDALAKNSVRFSGGYSVSPVCSPSRYGIETGKYPTRSGITNFLVGRRAGNFSPAALSEQMGDEICIAQKMKEGGYKTFFAGKYHLGSGKECWPENRGYDVNIGGVGRGSPGKGGYFSPYKNERLPDGPDGEYLPYRLTAEAQKFLGQKHSAPFYACVSYYLVHTPLTAPAPLLEKYQKKAAAMNLDPAGEYGTRLPQLWPERPGEPRRERLTQSNPTYAAMVEAMDKCVGELRKTLEQEGLMEDTVIVFFSDNGGLSTSEGYATSNLPLKAGKGWLYEGGIRVPMLVSVPQKFVGGGDGRVSFSSAVPVSGADFYPTICALAGVEVSHAIDGKSFLGLIRGEDFAPNPLYWHYPHYSNQGGAPGGAIRDGDWKLIENFEDGSVELYNLAEDPGEESELASRHPETAARLKRLLHAWYAETGAKFLEPRGENKAPWRP